MEKKSQKNGNVHRNDSSLAITTKRVSSEIKNNFIHKEWIRAFGFPEFIALEEARQEIIWLSNNLTLDI